jgi:hypothetical protein
VGTNELSISRGAKPSLNSAPKDNIHITSNQAMPNEHVLNANPKPVLKKTTAPQKSINPKALILLSIVITALY